MGNEVFPLNNFVSIEQERTSNFAFLGGIQWEVPSMYTSMHEGEVESYQERAGGGWG